MELINDRYELRSEISRGGFGITWYAWDNKLDMPVAVKEFSDPDPEHRLRFMKEARTLAQFSGSRGIVNVRDYLQDGEKVYMVMEYLDGEDLSTYVDQKGRLSLAETLRLLDPVMDVLEKLHAANMIHRDVSPDNIRLTGNGEIKLLDFGSAVNLTSENLTRTITVKPGYAPVEQYSGAAGQGPWTDVYSLCATIYKCITGRKPVDSLVRSFHDELELPSALGVNIDPAEEAVLMKGLRVRPEERYDSIGAFRTDISNAKEDSGEQSISELAAIAFGEKSDSNVPEFREEVETVSSGADITNEEKSREKTAVHKEKENAGDRKIEKKRKNSLLLPLILAGALIIGAVIFFFVRSGGIGITAGVPEGSDYENGNKVVYIENTTVTDDVIDFFKDREEVYSIVFSGCQISDEIMKRIPELTGVKQLEFNSCEGYNSLDPLADMPALEQLSLKGGLKGGLAGDQLITKDFPETLNALTINYNSVEGTTDFIWHFPGLKSLRFEIREDGCDMSFLDALPKLKELNISAQTMGEEACSHLYGHPDLQYVKLDNTKLATLGWAKECTGIKSISAENSVVTDLSPLADHTELTGLNLSGAPISDLTPLENSKELQILVIDHSNVESLAPLADHEKLYKLWIDHCRVSDLSPLSNTALKDLRASYNSIPTLEPIAGCTEMQTLDVKYNELTDLDGCGEMIKLTYLDAAGNHITDISGIRNCSLLETLLLSDNEIKDISALSNSFADLTILDIANNEVTDIAALTNCSALKAIAADNNKITSIEALAGKPELYAVLMSNNELKDIGPLKESLSQLSYIDIGNNDVSDLSALEELTVKKVWMLMENNNISDLSVLPTQLQYQAMVFYGNPIKDASFVETMENIYIYAPLYLSYRETIDYTSIGRCKFNSNSILVDVPSDKKASVLKKFQEGDPYVEPKFKSSEEADADLADYRKELRKMIVGDSEETEEENNG